MLCCVIPVWGILASTLVGSLAPQQKQADAAVVQQALSRHVAAVRNAAAEGKARSPLRAATPSVRSAIDLPCGEDMGACCYGEIADPGYEPYQCIGDMPMWDCLYFSEFTNWTGGASCSDPEFSCPHTFPWPCDSSGGCDEYIRRVQMGDIDNSSGCDQYYDYTDIWTTVIYGLEYPIRVTNGTPYDSDVCSIWVDWNQDTIFNDAAPDLIGDVVGGGVSPPYSFTLTVPPDAHEGHTHMRIRIDYDNPDPDPCGVTTYGEVEDYGLMVVMGETYGACCNPYTGECADGTPPLDCQDMQWHYNLSCGKLNPPCGDPGCCCDAPESGVITDPHFAYRANCSGRFLSGVLGGDCAAEAFSPQCGLWQPTGLLYAPSNPDSSTFRATVAALLNSPVDYFDARVGTPTVEQLEPYAAVLTWVNYSYADKVAMGDALADFVDAGGRVILGQWTLHTDQINWLEGRIMTAEYCPVASCSSYTSHTYQGDGVMCPFHGPAGEVISLGSVFADTIAALQQGAMSDGTFEGGAPALAFWLDFRVFYSPGNTGDEYGSGDWAVLTANMAACVSGPGACCNISTAECVDDVPAADCLSWGALWRARPDTACAELVPPCGDPGACCDVHTGACVDDVLEYNCLVLGREFHAGQQCSDLVPACGDPGCCCAAPEAGVMADPHFAYRANCSGRFIAGATPLCGDLDANGLVDMTDYNLFLDSFGKCAGQAGYMGAADMDADGCVSLVDFQQWRNCYEHPGAGCTADMFARPCGLWQPVGLLYAPAETDAPSFRAAVSLMLDGAPVDYFDARLSTPTVDQMIPYAAVLVWVNYPLFDRIAMSNNLADYVDSGGRVILGQWAFDGLRQSPEIYGRILDPEYCPVASIAGWGSGSYAGPSQDCVTMLGPVDALATSYLDHVTSLVPGSGSDGEFTNGAPVAAWRPDRRVYYSPGNMGGMYGATGDWAQLTANLVMCSDGELFGACCDPYDQPTPGEPGYCADDIALPDCSAPHRFYVDQTCAALDPPCGEPGACCNDAAGECADGVLKHNCWERHASEVLCADLVPGCGEVCEHRVDLWDAYGDGWHGDTLDVYVDGTLVLQDIFLPDGAGPLSFYFFAATGSEIHTVFYDFPCWCEPGYYRIYDGNGAFIIQDGGSFLVPTGVTVYGNCEPLLGACCDELTGACEDDVSSHYCDGRFYQDEQCEQLVPPCSAFCEHSVVLWDSYGDGWEPDWLDVYVDGELTLDHVTLPAGFGPLTFYFPAGTGSEIHTVYHYITFTYPGYYYIYDGVGLELALDGGSFVVPSGVTVYGNCDLPVGACCDDSTAVCLDGVAEVDCTGRFVLDALCAEIDPPCGEWICYDATIAAPGSWTGNTCGAVNDCTLRSSEDLTVRVIIPTSGNWQFDLCTGTSVWDTYLYVGADCCTNTWSDDDGCGTVLSKKQIAGLVAGTYYATLEAYSSACGPVTLAVSSYGPEDRSPQSIEPARRP